MTKLPAADLCEGNPQENSRFPSQRANYAEGDLFDNFVITGGTISCCYDNLRYHQWRQIDDFLSSMILALQDMHMLHMNFIVSWNHEENRHESFI